MIISRLQGGLGNQLFQYAAAKALSARLNAPFKLEAITSLQKDKLRKLALDDLQVNFELATKKEVEKFIYFPTLYRHRPTFFSRLNKHIYREPHFQFDQQFLQLNDPVYIDGFWQCPMYFKDIETTIRQEFTVKPELVADVVQKGRELEEKNSIAVHIRRGDLLKEKQASYHGTMNAMYYEKGIRLIKEKMSDATVHFFSDDIEWVKQNLVIDKNAEFISSFTKSAIEDFYLMTKCRHNIIANSSFSWWTAWLNNNPGKMVIAPKKWFVDTNINTSDLIPLEWIRI